MGDVADMRIELQDMAAYVNLGLPDIRNYEEMKDKLQHDLALINHIDIITQALQI